MKFSDIALKNFIGQQDFEHSFTKPVTVFTGPHGTGKTSIVQAMSIILTGTARGVSRKDRGALARGEDAFRITGTISHEEESWACSAAMTTQAPNTSELQRHLGPVALLKCLCDWREWERLDKAGKLKMLYAIGGGRLQSNPKLHPDMDARRRSHGPASALAKATENRRQYQRTIAEVGALVKPGSTAVVNGKDVDLRAFTREKILARERDLKKEHRKWLSEMVDASSLEKTSQEKLAELEAKAVELPKLQAAERELTDQVKKRSLAYEKIASQIMDHRAELKALSARSKAIQDASVLCDCPIQHQEGCTATGGKEAMIDSLLLEGEGIKAELEKLESDGELIQKELSKEQGELRGTKLRLSASEVAEREATRLRAARDEAKARGLDPDAASVKADAAAARASECGHLLRAFDAWIMRSEQYQEHKKKVSIWESEVERWAEQEQLLREELESGGGDSLGLFKARAERYAVAWGKGELSLDDDLMPGLAGRPFGLLSRAEQYIALLCVQAALAWVSGTRWVVQDDLDTLTTDFRKLWRGWATKLVEQDLEQVVGLIAQEEGKSVSSGPVELVAV